MSTEALKDLFDQELQRLQTKKAEAGTITLSLSSKAFHALLRQQFQTDRAGNLLVKNSGGVIPREMEWGQGNSVQIAQFAAGIVELQKSVLTAYLNLHRETVVPNNVSSSKDDAINQAEKPLESQVGPGVDDIRRAIAESKDPIT